MPKDSQQKGWHSQNQIFFRALFGITGWFLRRCAAKQDQFANAFFARMEDVSTTVPPPTKRKSSRDVYCLGTARSDCIADAPIQQIFQEQTCGVSDYIHRHDNAPTLGKEVSASMAASLEDEAGDGTGRTW